MSSDEPKPKRMALPAELVGLLRQHIADIRAELEALDAKVVALRLHHEQDMADNQNERRAILTDVHARLGHSVQRMDEMQKNLDDINSNVQLTLAVGSLVGAVALFIAAHALGF